MSAGTEQETEERAYVYMVRCAGGQLYTGWTNDPGARLHAHKTGRGAKATRAMGAERFAYLERCADRSAALRREAALKKLPKAKKEALCAGWEEKNLPRLSVASRADAKNCTTGMCCTTPQHFRSRPPRWKNTRTGWTIP